jgi:hypothetical protein
MIKRRIQIASHLMTVCIFGMAAAAGYVAAAPDQPKANPCSTPEYHQFDFWIGDWNAFDVDNPSTVVARTRVDLILEGCVLREDYQGTDGYKGQSFTIYDNRRNVWHQTWVTNHGELLEIEGQFANGEMELGGKNQQGQMVRGTWKTVTGGVREIGVKSGDGGKTWNPWFDIVFRRAPETASKLPMAVADDATSNKETVVALDSEYQEAVRRNDAVTMDRILADDFIGH